jgi:prolyl-tRNA synthetase
MGGNISHEFMLVHEIGEDTLYVCECGFRANKETLKDNDYICPKCQKELEKLRGIEIGNIFQLGDKYSKSMNRFSIFDQEFYCLKDVKEYIKELKNFNKFVKLQVIGL